MVVVLFSAGGVVIIVVVFYGSHFDWRCRCFLARIICVADNTAIVERIPIPYRCCLHIVLGAILLFVAGGGVVFDGSIVASIDVFVVCRRLPPTLLAN